MNYQKLKFLPILLIGFGLGLNLFSSNKQAPYLYFNFSKSLPRGIYLPIKKQPQVGDLVIIDLPPNIENFLAKEQKLSFSGLLLKPVIAAKGDYVCNCGQSTVINNQIRLSKDKRLNLFPICRHLETDEVFVAITNKENSLDSRYFGAIFSENLIAVVRPLITFG